MKDRGEKWAMLTAYDQYTAEIFDQAGIPVLLVGDSAANNVFGYESTLRVTVDELIPLARAVGGAVEHTLVVADLPFGSYQGSAEQAFHTAVRFMKEAGVHAVKLEGGRHVVPAVEKLVQAGIPVMAHIGFTPQSEHSIGGYRVQGRGDQAAALVDDAVALAAAGAFAVVLEMVPGDVAAEITKRIPVPTIRSRHRCPSPGLAGHGRPPVRPDASLREAVRRPARHPHRCRRDLRRRSCLRHIPG
jgi:3-methyl-2-oxobutanoate hydroxymethyltransferase